MTELIYQTDSYLQEFDAAILSVQADSRAVVLDRTAFYPGGGGQPCDFGSLEVAGVLYPVEKAKKQGEDVLHFLGGTEPLPASGSAARGTLDWARRYKLTAPDAEGWPAYAMIYGARSLAALEAYFDERQAEFHF